MKCFLGFFAIFMMQQVTNDSCGLVHIIAWNKCLFLALSVTQELACNSCGIVGINRWNSHESCNDLCGSPVRCFQLIDAEKTKDYRYQGSRVDVVVSLGDKSSFEVTQILFNVPGYF